MENGSFDFEFTSDMPRPDDALKLEARANMSALIQGHTDITGAAVAVEELTRDTTPHQYQARVVVYMRPNHVVAVEKAPEAMQALKSAFEAVERQVRTIREKLREKGRQP
jgi:ribosome-associated translation inhibitor RaiA